MPRFGASFWFLFVLFRVLAVKVLLLHDNSSDSAKVGLVDFLVPFLNQQGSSVLDLSLCEADLFFQCLAANSDIDAIISGTTVFDDELMIQSEQLNIPNLHCSTTSTSQLLSHAFSIQLPNLWKSQAVIRAAAISRQVKRIVVLREVDDKELSELAMASMEFAQQSSLTVLGPSPTWCKNWAHLTQSCSLRRGKCSCGKQDEFDDLGYVFDTDLMPSFYEISTHKVLNGAEFDSSIIQPAVVSFMEGIIEDLRSQWDDPEILVLNFFKAHRSALLAMKQKNFDFKMYFGETNVSGTYESYWNNTTLKTALEKEDVLYNLGAAQWHHEMEFLDPYFGSSQNMVSTFRQQFQYNPTEEHAACVAAGITLAFSLERYGQLLANMSLDDRREEIRSSLLQFHDETIFGMIRFDRKKQNVGRLPVIWQLHMDGSHPVDTGTAMLPSPSWAVRQGCLPGTFGVSTSGSTDLALYCRNCPEGTARNSSSNPFEVSSCDLCPPGRGTLIGETGATECEICEAGKWSEDGICEQCHLGTARSFSDSGCLPCAAGSFADTEGLLTCKPCPNGTQQDQNGQSFCLCEVGFYKDPLDPSIQGAVLPCLSCEEILPGSTTAHVNSRSSDECVCPPGTAWSSGLSNENSSCKVCGVGLLCHGGWGPSDGGKSPAKQHRAPLQAVGYAAAPGAVLGADPIYIVQCNSDVACPGGSLGSCPGNNMGIACMDCRKNHYLHPDDSKCHPCDGFLGSFARFIVFIILFLIVNFIVYKLGSKDKEPHREAFLTMAITAYLTLEILQALSAFSRIAVEWVGPLRELRGLAAFMVLHLERTLRLGCVLGTTSPVASYVASLVIVLAFATAIVLQFLIHKWLLCGDVHRNALINALGLFVLSGYIAIASFASEPYQCVGNPDGTSSLAYHRNVLCWRTSEHSAMLLCSFVPLALSLALLTLIFWTCYQYPYRFLHGDRNFLERWSFIFDRFHPKTYYFALILIIRNTLIAVVPVVLAAWTELQLILLAFTVVICSLLQVKLSPWRTLVASFIDAALGVLLIVVIVLGSLLLDFDLRKGRVAIEITLAAMVFAGKALLLTALFAIYHYCKPSKTYGIFLCHHRYGAGVLTRWLKMMLSNSVETPIFLDADQFETLDTVVNITAWNCQNMVIILTSETLSHYCCAAEIASAYYGNTTNIILVSCDGCCISRESIKLLTNIWTEEQKIAFANAGITTSMIVAAYEQLWLVEPIPLARVSRGGAHVAEHQHLAKKILGQCRGVKVKSRNSLLRRPTTTFAQDAKLMMLGDMVTPEPACCCRALQIMLQSKLQESVYIAELFDSSFSPNEFAASMALPEVILVVLTHGLLQNAPFVAVMAACPEHVLPKLVPIKADESFVYPPPIFWEDLLQGRIIPIEALPASWTEIDNKKVGKAFERLFNAMTLTFSSHGSESMQLGEIRVISHRLKMMLLGLDLGPTIWHRVTDSLAEKALPKVPSRDAIEI